MTSSKDVVFASGYNRSRQVIFNIDANLLRLKKENLLIYVFEDSVDEKLYDWTF